MDVYFPDGLQTTSINDWFNRDYFKSKQLFTSSYHHLSKYLWRTHSWSLPSDPLLSTDTIWIGNSDAENVLVLLSGTHGIEGYCGSAIQSFILNCLQQGRLSIPDSHAILMVHALNPWGMKWGRRCDQEGVDLNRNFINFHKIPDKDHEYDLVLNQLSVSDRALRQQHLRNLINDYGQSQFDTVFCSGQYHYSWAPFYGGIQPSYANNVIDKIIDFWKLQQRVLTVIDLHTGLGPWGYGELISDHPLHSNGDIFSKKIFGNSIATTANYQSFSTPKQGLLDYRWHKMMQDEGCFLTLEFGTIGTFSLFETLLNEHLFWRDNAEITFNDADYINIRKEMFHHFNPEDSYWRQSVLFKSWQVIQQALKAVQS